jgi:hypothetical protein
MADKAAEDKQTTEIRRGRDKVRERERESVSCSVRSQIRRTAHESSNATRDDEFERRKQCACAVQLIEKSRIWLVALVIVMSMMIVVVVVVVVVVGAQSNRKCLARRQRRQKIDRVSTALAE